MFKTGIVALTITASAIAHAENKVGVVLHQPGVLAGYNLFSPMDGAGSYLIDNEGRLIHHWDTEYRSNIGYLLDNGNLLRATRFGNVAYQQSFGGGAGHGIEELTWDGERVWEFVYRSEDYLMHHDIEPLPNGNVLIIAWERKTPEEAVAAGRDPELVNERGLWPLHVLEIEPTRPKGGKVVWEWHVWDHLIQDFDETKSNYGDVAAHPERVEINPPGLWIDQIPDDEREQLEALGYLSADSAGQEDSEQKRMNRFRGLMADWLHTNAIDYNEKLDQIALSVLGNNEIWIIDHSTTTEESRGSTGGRYGKGGDLLYRWGNPAAYRMGTENDQMLFTQHDVHWIPDGLPGAGNLLIFNNGRGRPGGSYSSVDEIVPPMNDAGGYVLKPGMPFGPATPTWMFTAPEKMNFYSFFISGAQRLSNGNTLICFGAEGIFFEVTREGKEVWRFVSSAVGPEGANMLVDEKPSNIVFRVHRYPPDHPAFVGKDLSPGPNLADYLKENPVRMPLTLEQYLDRNVHRTN